MNKANHSSANHGWKAGYRTGYDEGYRLGSSEAGLKQIGTEPVVMHNLIVMYVPQGFEAIDAGIAEALNSLVQQCIVVNAQDMLATALNVRPHLVLVMNGLHVFPTEHHDHLDQIRQQGIKTAVWYADDPYFTDLTAHSSIHYDYIFTHEQNCVSFYKSLGCNEVFYLPLAMTSKVFHPRAVEPHYRSEICFIGNAFWNRVAILDQMAVFLAKKQTMIGGGHWDRLKNYHLLKDRIRDGWIPIEETTNYYNGAKIVLNIHRVTEAGSDNRNERNIVGTSINPRTYEIAGCATLQMTDIRNDLLRLYKPGYDIETFTTVAELQQKINYYLAHEEERRTIAFRGLQTTRQQHHYLNRVQQILATVNLI